jgi:multiple antibiotic resistance protein
VTACVESAITFFIQMVIIVDPVVAMPVLLTITPRNTPQERRSMARRGCSAAFLFSAFFLLAGPAFLARFGIGTAAVLITGGVLLFLIALEMLYGRITGTGTTPREERLAEVRADVSLFPLAFPVLAGPGAVVTCLIFAAQAPAPEQRLLLLLASLGVFALTYLILARAELLMKMIGSLGVSIATRIMGLLLALLAVQYVISGSAAVFGG